MELEKYLAYQFTGDTEALVNDKVFEIKEWQKGNICANGITVDNNGHNEFYLFHEIQLREKPPEPKFKVGDTVRVKAKENCQDKSPYLNWSNEMDNYCLKYYTIKRINTEGNIFFDNDNHTWHPDWLELEVEPEMYPCADCGTLRTKAEGGTTFTVCDECWDKRNLKLEIEPELKEIELLNKLEYGDIMDVDIKAVLITNRYKIRELTTAVNQLIRRAK